jgi:Fe2+ or Zn2+ uptake regulation protein
MEAIEDYLSKHPGAADSEQGITRYWLPEMGLEASLGEVVHALDKLVEIGVIDRRELAGSQVIYCAKSPQRNAVDDNGEC